VLLKEQKELPLKLRRCQKQSHYRISQAKLPKKSSLLIIWNVYLQTKSAEEAKYQFAKAIHKTLKQNLKNIGIFMVRQHFNEEKKKIMRRSSSI
jgi:hypothetical protein